MGSKKLLKSVEVEACGEDFVKKIGISETEASKSQLSNQLSMEEALS